MGIVGIILFLILNYLERIVNKKLISLLYEQEILENCQYIKICDGEYYLSDGNTDYKLYGVMKTRDFYRDELKNKIFNRLKNNSFLYCLIERQKLKAYFLEKDINLELIDYYYEETKFWLEELCRYLEKNICVIELDQGYLEQKILGYK